MSFAQTHKQIALSGWRWNNDTEKNVEEEERLWCKQAIFDFVQHVIFSFSCIPFLSLSLPLRGNIFIIVRSLAVVTSACRYKLLWHDKRHTRNEENSTYSEWFFSFSLACFHASLYVSRWNALEPHWIFFLVILTAVFPVRFWWVYFKTTSEQLKKKNLRWKICPRKAGAESEETTTQTYSILKSFNIDVECVLSSGNAPQPASACRCDEKTFIQWILDKYHISHPHNGISLFLHSTDTRIILILFSDDKKNFLKAKNSFEFFWLIFQFSASFQHVKVVKLYQIVFAEQNVNFLDMPLKFIHLLKRETMRKLTNESLSPADAGSNSADLMNSKKFFFWISLIL